MKRIILLTMVAFMVAGFTASGIEAGGNSEIVIAQPTLMQYWDPVNIRLMAAYMCYSMVYDGLFGLGPDGYEKELLTDYKISGDSLTWDFFLQKGVKFHNGYPFSAEDVKFTFELLMGEKSLHSYREAFKSHIKEIEIVSDYHVRFHLNSPWLGFFSTFRQVLQPIGSKRYFEEVGAEVFAKKPVGTGPFVLVEAKPGEWSRFRANKNYWGKVPEIEYVTVKKVPETLTRFAMLVKGEADIITSLTPALIREIEKKEGLSLKKVKYSGNSFVGMNPANYPEFKDVRVRQALSLDIDREGICATLLYGVGEPANSLIYPACFGYDPDLPPIRYDPEKARKLLKEAGIKKGWTVEGLVHSPGWYPNCPQIWETIYSTWENDLGIKVKRVPIDTAGWLSRNRNPTAKMARGISNQQSGAPDDPSPTLWSYYTGDVGWGPNPVIKDPYIDDLTKKIDAAKTLEERKKWTRAFIKYEYEKQYYIPQFWRHEFVATGPKINKEWSPAIKTPYFLRLEHAKLVK
jgi:peptide/nickel transport system substrate-binding protein